MVLQLLFMLFSLCCYGQENSDARPVVVRRPQVGVCVFIVQDGKILLGLRKGSHGAGCWALPGGHLEYGETFKECVVRETLEETSLQITQPIFCACTNDIFEKEQKHYATIFMVTHECSGDVQLLEPDYCAAWKWFTPDEFPENLFLPLQNFITQYDLSEIV